MTTTPDVRRERLRAHVQRIASGSRVAIAELVYSTQEAFLCLSARWTERRHERGQPASGHSTTWYVTRSRRKGRIQQQLDELGAGKQPPAYNLPPGELMEVPDTGQTFDALTQQLATANSSMLQAIARLPTSPNLELTSLHAYAGTMDCLQWAIFQHIHVESHVDYGRKIIDLLSVT